MRYHPRTATFVYVCPQCGWRWAGDEEHLTDVVEHRLGHLAQGVMDAECLPEETARLAVEEAERIVRGHARR